MFYFIFLYFIIIRSAYCEMEIILINLDRRPDKLHVSDYQLKRLNITRYHRLSAVDGKLIKEYMSTRNYNNFSHLINSGNNKTAHEKLKIFDYVVNNKISTPLSLLEDKYAAEGYSVRIPEMAVGCTLSHLLAYAYIIDKNITNPVLILEDDFAADGEAIEKTERFLKLLPNDWALFYAGHCHGRMRCNDYKVDGYSVCNVGSRLIPCTHAYVVNGAKAAAKFYNAGNTLKLAPADLFVQRASLKRYIIYPYLFSQIKTVEADIQSKGGHRYKMYNETLLQEVNGKIVKNKVDKL